jgi:tRNA (guanine-N7-)-methyltransferase
MRLRNIKGSREIIASSPYVIHNIEEKKGNWSSVFENHNPIYIEVGMGKGRFIMELAKQNPKINFIGIEKYSSVLLRAIEKRKEEELDNVYFIRMDAVNLTEVFGKDEIERIYLNFSDPWPKERYAKRRLPSRQFFARYDQILAPEGVVEFKTDNRGLFDFALEEVIEANWQVKAHTFDLHSDEEMNQGNIMTEYEEKFSKMGNPIYKLIASREKV